MKKFFPMLLALVAFTACEKDPDLDKVENQVVTYTQYDKSANFASAHTYYIPDSIVFVNGSNTAYLDSLETTTLINAVKENMNSRGYVQTNDKDLADLGIQLSWIETTYYYAQAHTNDWWNAYPGSWRPMYWGNWWSTWYYPYTNIFSYTNGSLLTEMVDLSASRLAKADGLKVIWQSYSVGLLQETVNENLTMAVKGIDQAFAQSPYIKAN